MIFNPSDPPPVYDPGIPTNPGGEITSTEYDTNIVSVYNRPKAVIAVPAVKKVINVTKSIKSIPKPKPIKISILKTTTPAQEEYMAKVYGERITRTEELKSVETDGETQFKQIAIDNNLSYDFESELLGGRVTLGFLNIPFLFQNNIGVKVTNESNPLEDQMLRNAGVTLLKISPQTVAQSGMISLISEELNRAVNDKLVM